MGRSLEDILYDLVRLLPDDDRQAVFEGAALRRRALDVASKLGVKPAPDAVRRAAVAFRRARGLTRADELSAWCSDRGVGAEDFARLMSEEATLGASGSASGAVSPHDLADFLRVVDAADAPWGRAAFLRQRGDIDLTDHELLHEWFEACLGRAVPTDVGVEARRRGFDGEADLIAALRRTALARDAHRAGALEPGDLLPDFVLTHPSMGDLRPDLLAGRWWVLLLVDEPAVGRDAMRSLDELGGFVVGDGFDDDTRWTALTDSARAVRKRLGVVDGDHALLVSPAGRVVAVERCDQAARVVEAWREADAAYEDNAPVLMVRGAFEAAFCQRLIEAHRGGGDFAGEVTANADGARPLRDDAIKRRRDHVVDGALEGELRRRLARRVFPLVRRAFQFEVTGCEGFRVGCYRADDGGFFRAHRDDANPATTRRRFALSVNLAQGGYDGGRLVLPEHGASFDAPTGAALVYSASILHEVTPVSRGERFVLVGFFSGTSR